MVQPMYASTMPVVDARKRGRRPSRSMNREKVTETTRERMVWPPLSCEIHPSAFALILTNIPRGQRGGGDAAVPSYKDLVRLLMNTSTLIYLVGVI